MGSRAGNDDVFVIRGDIVAHHRLTSRRFVVVSDDVVTESGIAIVVDITDAEPGGVRTLLLIPVEEGWIRAYRVNYMPVESLTPTGQRVPAPLMEQVDIALRAAMRL